MLHLISRIILALRSVTPPGPGTLVTVRNITVTATVTCRKLNTTTVGTTPGTRNGTPHPEHHDRRNIVVPATLRGAMLYGPRTTPKMFCAPPASESLC